MEWDEKNNREEMRGTANRAEIGDVLLSARAVSRQIIVRAQGRAEETVKAAENKAAAIVREAEDKAAAIVREAEDRAAAIVREAEAGEYVPPRAEEPAPEVKPELPEAEPIPAVDVEKLRADAAAEAQEYAARCVEACLSELRQRQQDCVDFINEQWQSFLCGLMQGPEEKPTPAPEQAEDLPDGAEATHEEIRPAPEEITQQEIESKVNAIARELREISDQ